MTANNGHIDIGLVLTGGTIGAQTDDSVVRLPNGSSADSSPHLEALLGAGPPPSLGCVTHLRRPLTILSENVQPQDWLTMAECIRSLVEQERVSAILVLHGTDTMTYTAAALSFLTSDLDVPIVLTGSNFPPNDPDSDAGKNVHDALVSLLSLGAGTFVTFAGGPHLPGWVHQGCRVRKLRASGQAFFSVNREPVAQIVGDQFVPIEAAADCTPVASAPALDERVTSIRLYPGLDFDALYDSVRAAGQRGVVVELYASATGPMASKSRSLPCFISRCTDASIVVATTIFMAPARPGHLYESTVATREAGGIFLEDMLPEVATVKLMWALGQSEDHDSVVRLMATPVAGELSVANVR